MREQVCSSKEVHCGSARSTAEDSGFSDTRSIQVVSFHLRLTYRSCQWLLESFDLGLLCWLTFGRKSTVWQEISSRLDLVSFKLVKWILHEKENKVQHQLAKSMQAAIRLSMAFLMSRVNDVTAFSFDFYQHERTQNSKQNFCRQFWSLIKCFRH